VKSNLFIRYKGLNVENDSEIDLVALGESIAAFDGVIRELFEISGVHAEFEVHAEKVREGSVIIEVATQITDFMQGGVFSSPQDLINYLQVVNVELCETARQFFSQIRDDVRTVNDFAKEQPAVYDAIKYGITIVMGYLFGRARYQKKMPTEQCPDGKRVPLKYAKKLHRMVLKKGFKKVVAPLAEDAASSIEVSADRDFRTSEKIDQHNFEEYLPDDERILPELENGDVKVFIGQIRGIQSSRGDTLSFRFMRGEHPETLVTFPADEETSKSYLKFYQEDIGLEAEVIRTSMFKKPKLKVISVCEHQSTMFAQFGELSGGNHDDGAVNGTGEFNEQAG
jgi:hypothetical protein